MGDGLVDDYEVYILFVGLGWCYYLVLVVIGVVGWMNVGGDQGEIIVVGGVQYGGFMG